MNSTELDDLLKLIDAMITNRRTDYIGESVRFTQLKKDFIATWCKETDDETDDD